ncbi:MAG: AsmA family protein [Candidatus Omnitrophota bacterium]
MKKFLMILFALLLIALIGAGVFLMTLDVDKFRPQIVSQIENALNKPVRLDKIKLGWQSGVALELQGFAILKNKQSSEKLVEAESAKALLKLGPLLARQIQVATVYLNHPVIRLIKKPDGTFEGLEPGTQQPGPAQDQAVSAPRAEAALSFLVNEISIQNGELFYKDATGKEPLEIHLRKINVTVDNVALDEPIGFSAQAAVFSTVQNLDLKGKVTVASRDFTVLLNGFRAELRLMSLELQELAKMNPSIATSGIIFPVEGTLTVEADALKLDDKGLKEAAAQIRFDRGKVRLESLKGPIENISTEVLATASMIKIQKFTANLAEGKVEGQGAVNMSDPLRPATAFNVKAEKLKIEDLVPAPSQAGPQAKGLLSVVTQGNLVGQTPDEIKRTITADGTVTVEQAVITNMNVLREVFQKLSVIPGLVEKLLSRLPANYQDKLKEKDTKLETIQIPFSARQRVVQLPRLNAATDSFQIAGSGTYGLDQGAVAGAALLSIEPDLSAAMIRSVAELQYLTDQRKEIQIPLAIQGKVPKVTVMPDLQSVASKIAAQKATEAIGGLLKKAFGEKETPGNTASTPSTSSTSTPAESQPVRRETQAEGGGLFGELLRQGMKEISSGGQAPAADSAS